MSTPVADVADKLVRAFGQAPATQSEPEFQARLAQRHAEERESRVRELRSAWNAPRCHLVLSPSRDGPWGEKFATLEAKLGRGVLVGLVGLRGNGKTQLAVELMKRVTAVGRSALFRTGMELLMRLKQSYRKESAGSELDVLRAHRRPSLLVIDEIGRRGETEWENGVVGGEHSIRPEVVEV